MDSKHIVSLAKSYQRTGGTSHVECMVEALIDVFTGQGPGPRVDPDTIETAWDSFTKPLSSAAWLRETQILTEHLGTLAANLREAGRQDLAAVLYELQEPDLDGETATSITPGFTAGPALA
jgi:hypothetical protein